ncbi:MAG TPA: hypothetical protein VD886_02395 [Herpetosiphonaceae bacterium]|nr:hypothetical protein [Herpetosiphonaceae bacterium]
MHQIQILLPLYDNEGAPFDPALYAQIRDELTERFGGLTTYLRSPATGLWKQDSETTVRDEIVIYEVMAEALDKRWWRGYRAELSRIFQQEELVVRASAVTLL